MTVALFAGIRVRDVTAARAWYERLLGEPSFFPNATEVVWTLADDRSLYIKEDPGRAGGALITLFVDDLDALISEIGSRSASMRPKRPGVLSSISLRSGSPQARTRAGADCASRGQWCRRNERRRACWEQRGSRPTWRRSR